MYNYGFIRGWIILISKQILPSLLVLHIYFIFVLVKLKLKNASNIVGILLLVRDPIDVAADIL